MVEVIKFGTFQMSNFDSAFLAKLVFAYLGQNRITHYQSSALLLCASFFNFFFCFFQTGMCSVIDCKFIIFSTFSCFLDKFLKLISSAVDGLYKMEVNFIIIIKSTNRNTVDWYSFYYFFFISISNVTSITVIFVYGGQIPGVSNSTDKIKIDKLIIIVLIRGFSSAV